jgi:hypothetical protein
MSIKIPIWIDPGMNLDLHGDRLATNCQSHGMAQGFGLYMSSWAKSILLYFTTNPVAWVRITRDVKNYFHGFFIECTV